MNKKLAALLALIFGFSSTPAFADDSEPCQKNTNTGNVSNVGAITATNLNPVFFTAPSGQPMGFNVNTFSGFQSIMQTNQALIAASPNPQPGLTSLIQITGFSLQCLAWNPALVGAPGNPYNAAETNGVAGGTVTIHEYKPIGAAVVVGTVVLPSSPHNGPYINTAISKLQNPYTPTAGSTFDAEVTASSYGSPYTNAYQFCTVAEVLQ